MKSPRRNSEACLRLRKKNKHVFWVFIASLLLSIPSFAFAELSITEVFYDYPNSDSHHEWIEIYNGGESAIDLSSFKFKEGETNHRLLVFKGDQKIPPQAYAVIAESGEQFLADYPSYSGILFDSTFSLSNTGETLALLNASGTAVDSISYSSSEGASGNGYSLQKINDAWFESTPTPGATNVLVKKTTVASQAKTSDTAVKSSQKKTIAALHGMSSQEMATTTSLLTSRNEETDFFNENLKWIVALAALIIVAIGGTVALRSTSRNSSGYEIVGE